MVSFIIIMKLGYLGVRMRRQHNKQQGDFVCFANGRACMESFLIIMKSGYLGVGWRRQHNKQQGNFVSLLVGQPCIFCHNH